MLNKEDSYFIFIIIFFVLFYSFFRSKQNIIKRNKNKIRKSSLFIIIEKTTYKLGESWVSERKGRLRIYFLKPEYTSKPPPKTRFIKISFINHEQY